MEGRGTNGRERPTGRQEPFDRGLGRAGPQQVVDNRLGRDSGEGRGDALDLGSPFAHTHTHIQREGERETKEAGADEEMKTGRASERVGRMRGRSKGRVPRAGGGRGQGWKL